METIRELQAYAYVGATVFLVVMMYGYLYHLFKAEKKGTRNYEQYGKIALQDNIDDAPIETRTPSNKEKE